MEQLRYARRQVGLPEKLLDKVNVGHNHAPTAISLASELVHGVSVYTH